MKEKGRNEEGGHDGESQQEEGRQRGMQEMRILV